MQRIHCDPEEGDNATPQPGATARKARGDGTRLLGPRPDAHLSLAQWRKRLPWSSSAKHGSIAVGVGLFMFVLSVPAAALLSILLPEHPEITLPTFFTLAVGGFIVGVGSLVATVTTAMKEASGLPAPESCELESVGELLDRSLTDFSHHSRIVQRLTVLLPRLQPEHEALLARRHYEILNGHLHRAASATARPRSALGQRGIDFLRAILVAYGSVGDPAALSDVERLASGKGAPGLVDEACVAAAQDCLPHLRHAAEAVRARDTLLRATRPSPGEAGLLRAARMKPDHRKEALLLPSELEHRQQSITNTHEP